MKINLDGKWEFKQIGTDSWYIANVPGCNYLDLLNNGLISDPFVSNNEKDCYWVSQKDWLYRRQFTVTDDMLDSQEVVLIADMLDTICDISINGKLVGSGENCHIKYEFNIKPYLTIGDNLIEILFYSPVNYVSAKQAVEKCPRNNNGQDGVAHIRKPQCHFGWDWGPVLPPSGISGSIAIETRNVAKIEDILITQEHTGGVVNVTVGTTICNMSTKVLNCVISIVEPSGKIITNNVVLTDQMTTVLTIENPELWWTHELSKKAKQPLYSVKVEIFDNETLVDSLTRRIGLRTIVLNREKDKYGANFQFVLNGVPLFIKGANWIPADSFITRYTRERLIYDLEAVVFSNMNMLRIWGGGYYESDLMYDLCDEMGILMWQDFPFACQAYPFFDDKFLSNVKAEVSQNITRLRHHASLAVWCGNNEIECMSLAWITRVKYVEWTDKFFYNILPPIVKENDNLTSYIPGSPCGIEHMKGFGNDNVGDTHLWAVWHGLQPMNYYRKRMTRFCSEFGFESLPDIKTIERFATPADYSLTSEIFTAHQKCNSGNMKMAYYIASRFRLPKRFEDYIYLSQICQQECIKDATEHWRRNKGRCNGAMYWQMNDCWPVCSWASMDYYGNYKALQYTARHFNAPVAVSIEDKKNCLEIYAVNDLLEDIADAKIITKAIDFDGNVLYQNEQILELSNQSVNKVVEIGYSQITSKDMIKKCVLVVDLTIAGKLINRKTHLFCKEKDIALPKANIVKSVVIDGGYAKITFKSDKFVRLLQITSLDNTLPYSDNYFDLLPKEEVTITQKLSKSTSEEEYLMSFELFSAADVVPKGSRLSDWLVKAGVFLTPINFFNFIYYSNIPKDL